MFRCPPRPPRVSFPGWGWNPGMVWGPMRWQQLTQGSRWGAISSPGGEAAKRGREAEEKGRSGAKSRRGGAEKASWGAAKAAEVPERKVQKKEQVRWPPRAGGRAGVRGDEAARSGRGPRGGRRGEGRRQSGWGGSRAGGAGTRRTATRGHGGPWSPGSSDRAPHPRGAPAPRPASLRAGSAPAAPGPSPPARVCCGARGKAPEARPHCDVAGPRQRLRRPPAPAAAVPAPAAAVHPSVRPSVVRAPEPLQRRAPPVSPGPGRAPRGGGGRRRGRLSLSKFAPGDRGGCRPGSHRAPGPLCAASPGCSSSSGASAERVWGEVSTATAAAAAKRLLSLGEGGRAPASISKGLFFSFAGFVWVLFLLLPGIVSEAGMGSAAAPKSWDNEGRSNSNSNSTTNNNSNRRRGTPGVATAQGEPLAQPHRAHWLLRLARASTATLGRRPASRARPRQF